MPLDVLPLEEEDAPPDDTFPLEDEEDAAPELTCPEDDEEDDEPLLPP